MRGKHALSGLAMRNGLTRFVQKVFERKRLLSRFFFCLAYLYLSRLSIFYPITIANNCSSTPLKGAQIGHKVPFRVLIKRWRLQKDCKTAELHSLKNCNACMFIKSKKKLISASWFIHNAIMGTISALTESEIQAIKDPDLHHRLCKNKPSSNASQLS